MVNCHTSLRSSADRYPLGTRRCCDVDYSLWHQRRVPCGYAHPHFNPLTAGVAYIRVFIFY